MRHCLLCAILAAVVAAGTSCLQPKAENKTSADAQAQVHGAPMVGGRAAAKEATPDVKPEEPLLLLDDVAVIHPVSENMADNSRCAVCHLNLVQEELARTHAKAGVGCAKCHGPSDAHIADESWASGGNGTAPDIMYPKQRINPFCLECHPRAKLDADQHRDFFAGTSQEKYCIDCHGKHLLPMRKCKWK
jgi:hypothetical protein